MLFYGAKRWFVFPPHRQILSNKPISEWVDEDLPSLLTPPFECTQEAGDIMFVPHGWTHGVLNLKSTIAVAMETDSSRGNPMGKSPI